MYLCVNDFHDIFQDNYWEDAYLKNQIHQKLQKIWIALWNDVIVVQTNNSYKIEDARLFKIINFLQKNYQKNLFWMNYVIMLILVGVHVVDILKK